MYIDVTILAGLVIVALTSAFLVWGVYFAYKKIESESAKHEASSRAKLNC